MTAYKVEYAECQPPGLKKSNEVSCDETTFTLTDRQPGTQYLVTVTPVTSTGIGRPTEITAITSKPVVYDLCNYIAAR